MLFLAGALAKKSINNIATGKENTLLWLLFSSSHNHRSASLLSGFLHFSIFGALLSQNF